MENCHATYIENQKLGVLYILSSLTLVSQPARDAMPWKLFFCIS